MCLRLIGKSFHQLRHGIGQLRVPVGAVIHLPQVVAKGARIVLLGFVKCVLVYMAGCQDIAGGKSGTLRQTGDKLIDLLRVGIPFAGNQPEERKIERLVTCDDGCPESAKTLSGFFEQFLVLRPLQIAENRVDMLTSTLW